MHGNGVAYKWLEEQPIQVQICLLVMRPSAIRVSDGSLRSQMYPRGPRRSVSTGSESPRLSWWGAQGGMAPRPPTSPDPRASRIFKGFRAYEGEPPPAARELPLASCAWADAAPSATLGMSRWPSRSAGFWPACHMNSQVAALNTERPDIRTS